MVSLPMEWIAIKKPFPSRTRKDVARGTTLFRSIGLRDNFIFVAERADADPHLCDNGHTMKIAARSGLVPGIQATFSTSGTEKDFQPVIFLLLRITRVLFLILASIGLYCV
jgi:hypothetical protein